MSKSFYDLLNEQIGHEFAASHQYLSMAIWLDGEDLPQLAKFFYRQSLEEREHALMMVQYKLDRGHKVEIPAVPDEIGGDAHEQVQHAPNDGEHDRRRGEGRLR